MPTIGRLSAVPEIDPRYRVADDARPGTATMTKHIIATALSALIARRGRRRIRRFIDHPLGRSGCHPRRVHRQPGAASSGRWEPSLLDSLWMTTRVPDKPTLDGIGERWAHAWESGGVYRFDRSRARREIFSIDTPPPTVSGSLHMGSAFGYVQTDALARYQRMQGREVFYPMGWDDNGLPTERRVQNYFGVRCDPSLHFDPGFTPPESPPKEPIPISRPNFVELCHRLTQEDEKVFETLWRRLGLSVDWTQTYATIDDRSRRACQRAFLRNLARGEAYQQEAPTLWDIDFQTAV